MNTFTVIFLIALASSYGIQFWLSLRQKSYVIRHREQVPAAFRDKVSLAAHQKAADYTVEKSKLGDIDSLTGMIFLIALTLGGGISLIFDFWTTFDLPTIVTGLLAVASIFLLMALVDIPFSLYQTFVIEEKFGFNKNTLPQFIKDQLISLALTQGIGLPVLALILWVMDSLGNLWWLCAWLIIMSFSLLMSWLFPTVIAPLFNKFTPMADGSLKLRIQNLLERCGFNSQGIFIMDGSRRSGHGNAYFTGLGNNKRIVFFDTLIDSLDEDELEAVLAHELGHFRRRHVIKMLFASAIMTLISFAVLGWLINKDWFFDGLGISTHTNAAALLVFMLVSPVFTTFMQPISAYFQRRFEFEADDFAIEHAQGAKMISGLVKLYEENASTLTPDPLYSAFHYSHPPAAIRIAHIEEKLKSA
ncbi:MAG: M48 family metallopeptidase [Methylococcales bacterium]|nr:M48 family metallopeptidase [Methylococcales bacterium]